MARYVHYSICSVVEVIAPRLLAVSCVLHEHIQVAASTEVQSTMQWQNVVAAGSYCVVLFIICGVMDMGFVCNVAVSIIFWESVLSLPRTDHGY